MNQHTNSSTHKMLTERGLEIAKLKTTGNGDWALSLIEYDDGTVNLYTNGDPVNCESWEDGLKLLKEEGTEE